VKRAFLLLPSLAGHRQVYCRQLCDYFLSRDMSVTVATDLASLEEYERADEFQRDPGIEFVADPCADEAVPSKQLRRLVTAAKLAGADLTFLAEADDAHGLLSAQIARPRQRLPGRKVGLFIRSSNYVHELNLPRMSRIPRAVVAAYTYRPVSATQPRVFHEVVMRRPSVLDAALCLDEVFVSRQGTNKYVWLPDIAVYSSEHNGHDDETTAWQARVSAFMVDHEDEPVVVYAGTPQARRGYDLLLRLACDVGGRFIQCGRLASAEEDQSKNAAAVATLASRLAILEFGGAYRSFDTAQVALRAARCVVLPYSGHLGSSGVMLQALMAGRPVLVPDQGLMAWRVRNFGLGLTFAPGDWRDMRQKFSIMQETPPEIFAAPIRRFLQYFTRSQFEAAMDLALGLSEDGPRVPSADQSDWVSSGVRSR